MQRRWARKGNRCLTAMSPFGFVATRRGLAASEELFMQGRGGRVDCPRLIEPLV